MNEVIIKAGSRSQVASDLGESLDYITSIISKRQIEEETALIIWKLYNVKVVDSDIFFSGKYVNGEKYIAIDTDKLLGLGSQTEIRKMLGRSGSHYVKDAVRRKTMLESDVEKIKNIWHIDISVSENKVLNVVKEESDDAKTDAEADAFTRWIDECCGFDRRMKISLPYLETAFYLFCSENSLPHLSYSKFENKLESIGLRIERIKGLQSKYDYSIGNTAVCVGLYLIKDNCDFAITRFIQQSFVTSPKTVTRISEVVSAWGNERKDKSYISSNIFSCWFERHGYSSNRRNVLGIAYKKSTSKSMEERTTDIDDYIQAFVEQRNRLGNSNDIITDLLKEQRKTNELLERLINIWGCE